MKIVIAGTHQEFLDYLRENKLSQMDARFADRLEHVQGMRGAEVVTYGRWYLNPLSKMMNSVKALTSSGDSQP